MTEEVGWLLPEKYTSPDEEAGNAKEYVGVHDSGAIGKVDVRGVEIEKFLRGISPKGKSRVGQALELKLGDATKSPDPSLWCRLSIDNALILTGSDGVDSMITMLDHRARGCVHMTDVSSGYSGMSIIGPRARELISRLSELDVSSGSFPDLSCSSTKFAGVYANIIRNDLNGLLQFMVLVGRDYGEYVWNEVLHAGKDLDVKPVGTTAYKTLG